MSAKNVLLSLNKFFPLPVHPFNLQNEGKTVLDIGCGAAGKSLYYASMGANKVYGVDVVAHYKEESEKLAEQKVFRTSLNSVSATRKSLRLTIKPLTQLL